jgi:hypothetical protein
MKKQLDFVLNLKSSDQFASSVCWYNPSFSKMDLLFLMLRLSNIIIPYKVSLERHYKSFLQLETTEPQLLLAFVLESTKYCWV